MGRELDGETAGSPYVKMARMKLTGRKHTRRVPALPRRKTRATVNPEMKSDVRKWTEEAADLRGCHKQI